MQLLKWLFFTAASSLVACKGAQTAEHSPPEKQKLPVQSVEATATVNENTEGDLLPSDQPQDTAVTPILVTGTYLTCVDVAVTKAYDYEERGRIVGCRLIDRKTGKQVAMERIAHSWDWRVQTPFGVNAVKKVNDNTRALYPLVLELKGQGIDGRDILETLVEVTLDLILPVNDPFGHILSAVLNEFLKAIPPDQLEEQIIFPPPVDPETLVMPPTDDLETIVDSQSEADATQGQQSVQDDVPNTQQGNTATTASQEQQELGSDNANQTLSEPASVTLPSSVTVEFAISERPGGARVTMSPRVAPELAVSDEVFRVTGEIVAESVATIDQDLHVSWRYPVEISFRLNEKVTCTGAGFVGSSFHEVATTCR